MIVPECKRSYFDLVPTPAITSSAVALVDVTIPSFTLKRKNIKKEEEKFNLE
jgi:hypothetical protein